MFVYMINTLGKKMSDMLYTECIGNGHIGSLQGFRKVIWMKTLKLTISVENLPLVVIL